MVTSTSSVNPVTRSPIRPRGRSRLLPLLGLVLLFVIEFFLFDHFGSRRVTGIFPRWNDQIQYLSEAYTGYEYARAHGLGAGLWKTLVNPSAQGTLHDFAAVIEFRFVGASRSAALALNMLALIAWQAALFIAVRRRTTSNALSFAAAMLPLALRGPWLIVPGSANDFRLDHFAMCAIGVTSAVALLTDSFRSRRWSILFGVATAITLLTRFLTGTYFVLMFLALLVWALAGNDRLKRVGNILLAGIVAAVIAGPVFWVNREWVWNYYYIGHYVGPESAIRNQNFGLWRSTQFVWGWLGERHLGVFFGALSAAVALALGIVAVIHRVSAASSPTPAPADPSPARHRIADIVMYGLTFLLAPALILTLHPQKSDVVLSALAPGVILLVIAAWLGISRNITVERTWSNRLRTLIGAAAVIGTLMWFGKTQATPGEDAGVIANLKQVNTVADYIFTRSEAEKLQRPKIAVDYITDALDAQVLRVICYERHHVWIDFDMRLPTGIAEPDAKLVRDRVAESDFVFLIADDQPFGGFPYDKKLLEMRPELRAWCEAHLRPAMRFTFWGHPMVLYQRRAETLIH
jgi:hypothetical protein